MTELLALASCEDLDTVENSTSKVHDDNFFIVFFIEFTLYMAEYLVYFALK